nr:SDR family NAD(P)-dependent oxidoreductase [Micromonospora sp. DSM 115978]
ASFGTPLLERFAREGFALATISRSADTVARVAGELATLGLSASTAVADVTDEAAFTAAVGRLAAEIGGLTVVVYNAKLSIRGTALTVAAQTLNQTLAVNVTGALTTVQAALPLLADRPGASIIFTTAGTRTSDSGGRFALALGKAGLAALGASVGP